MANLKRQVLLYPAEMMWNLIKSMSVICLYAWFFYRSPWALPVLLPLGLWLFQKSGNVLEQKKKRELEKQFLECMMSVSAGLRAGYSVENAFLESIGEMQVLFGVKSRIVKELEELRQGMKNNVSLVQLVQMMARESSSGHIQEFAEILSISVKGGGNLTEIISHTAETMQSENRTMQEIEDVISGRKLEAGIMSAIPFLLAVYIQIGNPGYFDMLYHNPAGIFIMTACLAVYLIASEMIKKITNIVAL